MCKHNDFFGFDFDGDGKVSAFESFLTYQAVNGVLDKQNGDDPDELDELDELDGLYDIGGDDFGGFDCE